MYIFEIAHGLGPDIVCKSIQFKALWDPFFVHDDPQHGRVIWVQSKLFFLLIIKLDVMHVSLMDLESILRMPNHRLLNDEKLGYHV